MIAHFNATPGHTATLPLERCRRGHALIVDDMRANNRRLDYFAEQHGTVSGYGRGVLLDLASSGRRNIVTAITLRPARITIKTHCARGS